MPFLRVSFERDFWKCWNGC